MLLPTLEMENLPGNPFCLLRLKDPCRKSEKKGSTSLLPTRFGIFARSGSFLHAWGRR
jgi:hypothetical protein